MKEKLTPQDIAAAIVKEDYHRFPDTTLTICCLTLVNGYTVTGESACVNPANFNEELGRSYAKDDAARKIWQLEGYLLKQEHYLAAGNAEGREQEYQKYLDSQ